MNQNNINNNMNFNPFNFQQNPLMTVPPIYQMNNNPIDQINIPNQDKFFNVYFQQVTGARIVLVCKEQEKVSEMIRRYREKTNDNADNYFLLNALELDTSSNKTLKELLLEYGVVYQNGAKILVHPKGNLKF